MMYDIFSSFDDHNFALFGLSYVIWCAILFFGLSVAALDLAIFSSKRKTLLYLIRTVELGVMGFALGVSCTQVDFVSIGPLMIIWWFFVRFITIIVGALHELIMGMGDEGDNPRRQRYMRVFRPRTAYLRGDVYITNDPPIDEDDVWDIVLEEICLTASVLISTIVVFHFGADIMNFVTKYF